MAFESSPYRHFGELAECFIAFVLKTNVSRQTAPWVEKVLAQCEMFPRGTHDDLVDSMTMALKFMKDQGLIAHNFELAAELRDAMEFKPEPKVLYDA